MKKLTHILIVLVLLLSLGSNAVFSTNNRTQPFTDEYHFLRSWGGEGLFAPKGIDFTSDGTVLVVDESANRLTLLNPYLQVSNNWGDFGQEPSQFDQPLDTAIDHLGNIYVSDSGNDRIQKFSPTGEFILEWGSHGSYPGQFYFPCWYSCWSRRRNLCCRHLVMIAFKSSPVQDNLYCSGAVRVLLKANFKILKL